MYRLVAYGQDGVHRFPLSRQDLLVGSRPECDIYLPYTGVAQRHARIWRDEDRIRIEDLGSRRGILVNGRRVREALLQVLDEIRLGNITLLLEDVLPDGGRQAAVPVAEEVEAPSEVTVTPLGLTEHLAGISNWVLADSESRTTLESMVRQVLLECGGGVWFLLHGGVDNPGIKFVVSTRAEWLSCGEELLAQARNETADGKPRTGAFWGRLAGERCWIFRHLVTAMDRSYVLLAALPRFSPDGWSPVSALTALGDLLILGLVHHVGRYEPILPGLGGQQDLTLAPGLILGESQVMAQVIERLRAVADPAIHVHLRGEPGSGRELLARTLHLSGPQRHGPFVVASCSGARPSQIEADIFGAEIAGKEGPVRREGKLFLANGGTLLLQDIELLPLELQSRLVRFLRSGEAERSDGPGAERIDVRVIASSRGPLEPYVARDSFRVDLAYRLSQFAVDVPPLRERREDLPLLIQWYVNRFCHEAGKRMQGITVKAMASLMDYDFPGNLPELENIARQMVYLCPSGQPMDTNLLPTDVRTSKVRAVARLEGASDLQLDRLVSSCEQAAIREALRRTMGNKSQAAKLLGLSRNGLAMKIERYGLQ
jgi:transcriptional regulator with AAA-type ATPase domain